MHRIFTLLLAMLITADAFCQVPTLVKDINPNTADAAAGSLPGNALVLNGKLYFAATDYQGREPWKTDGTSGGTVILKDILSNTPNYPSNPHSLVSFGSTIYFFTGDSSSSQLWKTGSDDTVRFVMAGFVYPHDVVTNGTYIFFSANVQSSNKGQELIMLNPATDTLQVYDINPGTTGSDPRYITVKRDSLFFSADDGVNGREFWIYDPISFNKVDMVSDINSGPDPSNPSDFTIYHDTLFFSANLGPDGVELVYSDGLVGGANTGFFFLDNENGGADSSNPAHKTVFNNKLIFSATDGLSGTELWAYDGSNFNPFILADINTTTATASSNPGKYGFLQAGLFLYFAANDGINGNELWRTDGITGGTTAMVQNINPGSASSEPQNMYNLGDTLIFVATTSSGGNQIWRAKFNTAAMIQSIQPTGSTNIPNLFASYNNKIYFGADNGTIGNELYATNGLSAGTALVKDIFNNSSATNSNIQWMETFNGSTYFSATKNSVTEANGLWKSDATTSGTVEVVPSGGASGFYVAAPPGRAAGTLLFFRGHNNTFGEELWKSDGTAVGTVMVKDINGGTNSSSVSNITPFGSKVLFLADDGTNGNELWISDGTAAGTTLLKNINTTAGFGSFVQNITVAGSKAFFTADDGVNGRELWITDGTTVGTVMKNINPGAPASNPGGLTASGSNLYFYANDGTNGNEPWKSDGTLVGTNMITNINAGNNSSVSAGFCPFGGFNYFSANDGTGSKLWRTDGTAIGTTLFNSVESPYLITSIGSKMVFFSFPTVHPYGYELYASDGVTVSKLRDFSPGKLDILPDSFSVSLGHAFCPLDDNIHGQELFNTDGSTGGSILYDIAPNAASSYPRSMKGSPLLFSAYDGSSKGNELWKFDIVPVLPITGLEFNVSKKDNSKAWLVWKTYAEFDNKGFEIQRSKDGRDFSDSLGFVNARAFAGAGASYEFIDANPLPGRSYYRLKQKDIDGRFSFSPVRWVDFGKDLYIKLYPNPATDLINISSSTLFKNAVLNIRNSGGQLVKQQLINGSGTFSIPVKALPAGNYFIDISEGDSITRLGFTKQ